MEYLRLVIFSHIPGNVLLFNCLSYGQSFFYDLFDCSIALFDIDKQIFILFLKLRVMIEDLGSI